MTQEHLVGSVGLADTETVFRTVSEVLGDACPRIPDGETGERTNWIGWQRRSFEASRDLEPDGTAKGAGGQPLFRIRDRVAASAIVINELGYAREAIRSWHIFERLSRDGAIAPDTRFQVSLPTPMALLCGFVVMADRLALEAAFERAMLADLRRIQDAIPAGRLCIQWDVAFEVLGAAGGPPLPYPDALDGSIARIARLSGHVHDAVQLGMHLCYGDPGHKHIVEPSDLGIAVAFANAAVRASPHPLAYIHMPVPCTRSDDAYFEPLRTLSLPDPTRLVLGLVHFTDGVAGSRRRIDVASRFAPEFDIATECGFGRRDPATIPELLRIHRTLCSRT